MKAVGLGAIVAALVFTGCAASDPPSAQRAQSSGLRYLRGEAQPGFVQASAPRRFTFPEDHGSHPEYRTEWWYFTGNLVTEAGRHFGFQLTFFRYALGPEQERAAGDSPWRTRQAWMAHLTVTDTAAGRFHSGERFARGALGLAGADTQPLHIWVKDWFVAGDASLAATRLELRARSGDFGVALDLDSGEAPVLQGDAGFDRKGAGAGNASYYYSMPRLSTRGTVTTGRERFAVSGLTWMDREWGTSALEAGVAGWDWVALQLSDGRDLMFYRLRTAEGGVSAFSSGSIGRPRGDRTRLGARDVEMAPVRWWRSPATGARYPVAWRLAIPGVGLDLRVEPRLDEQEVALSLRYWEGAVTAGGRGENGEVTAQGYLELTGY